MAVPAQPVLDSLGINVSLLGFWDLGGFGWWAPGLWLFSFFIWLPSQQWGPS